MLTNAYKHIINIHVLLTCPELKSLQCPIQFEKS